MRHVTRLLVLVGVLLALAPRPSPAQEGAPGAAALRLLPEAAAFGEEWVGHADPVRFVPSEVFRDGALVAYGGPAGARVVLAAMLVTGDRVAVRAAWEAALKSYDRYRNDLSYDEGFAEELGTLPPPAGCAEAKRIEGTSEIDTFVTGVTLCAADPDVVLLAVVSGRVADLTGYRASDAVVAAVLADQAVTGDAAGTPTS